MGLFANTTTPNLPHPPATYSEPYMRTLLGVIRLYLNNIGAVQQINTAKINISVDTLPTEADVATLRAGDVYRDSTADNVLKIKT